MENNTLVTLDVLREQGRVIDQFCIDPARDMQKDFSQPSVRNGEKLYAYSETSCEQDRKLDEITTSEQFGVFIKGIKDCRFGYHLGDPDPVFTTIYSLAV